LNRKRPELLACDGVNVPSVGTGWSQRGFGGKDVFNGTDVLLERDSTSETQRASEELDKRA